MTKVFIDEDCGNSPKNIFVQQVTVALIRGDIKFLLETLTDDVCWNIPGSQAVQGKDQCIEALNGSKRDPALKLHIHHIATHGKAGAVDGRIQFKSGKTQAFCNMYEFGNAKGTNIKEITSYLIEIQ